MTLALEGKLDVRSVPEHAARLAEARQAAGPVSLDLSRVTSADSAGVALLSVFARDLARAGRKVDVVGASPELLRTLDLFPAPSGEAAPARPPTPTLERLGGWADDVRELVIQYLVLVADTTWFMLSGPFVRRGIRWNQVLYEMSAMGSQAIGVVGLIAFLIGGTMALQSAAQLRQFGANIFVVDLIGISMTRELGPLMAAIVVAGRSGSAVAAELGTMVITEEIDALRTMGLHPTRFLVVPKVMAITFTQPLVTMLANFAGIAGGFLVGVYYLDIGPDTFIARLQETLQLKDVVTGLIKSVMFAQLIVTIGALCGLRTAGGADAVGRSTTTSVVAGIFAVIVADAVASLAFYF
jgi:phospholipid/cholesterol/gamma-HCH transport system permease protein